MIWILLVLVLGAAGWVWYRVQNDESGAFSCCGCGQCAAAGECVMRRRVKREKGKDHLDKPNKKGIITLLNR